MKARRISKTPLIELVIRYPNSIIVQGRTVITIAHRLSTIKKADYIVMIDQGAVGASGTYEELMQSSDAFKELVQTQIMVDEASS